jgi:hypothetical protein
LFFHLVGLDVGVYNYTLVVYDGAGNSASDTVWVKVESSSTGFDITDFILQNLVVIVITGSAAVILVVSVLYPKFRR